MVTKGPLSDEIEGLDCDATASNPTIKPIERLGPTSGDVWGQVENAASYKVPFLYDDA